MRELDAQSRRRRPSPPARRRRRRRRAARRACSGSARRAASISPPTTSPPITPMLKTLAPERGDAAVGEHERLHAEHDREHQAREPWPEQDRRQRGAEEVPAGAARDREVEHLRREHERGGDAEQRHAALVEVDARRGAGRSRPRRPPGPRRRPRPRSRGTRQECAWRSSSWRRQSAHVPTSGKWEKPGAIAGLALDQRRGRGRAGRPGRLATAPQRSQLTNSTSPAAASA